MGEEASTRLDDQMLLSEPIKELAKHLALRLHQEAQYIVGGIDEVYSKVDIHRINPNYIRF